MRRRPGSSVARRIGPVEVDQEDLRDAFPGRGEAPAGRRPLRPVSPRKSPPREWPCRSDWPPKAARSAAGSGRSALRPGSVTDARPGRRRRTAWSPALPNRPVMAGTRVKAPNSARTPRMATRRRGQALRPSALVGTRAGSDFGVADGHPRRGRRRRRLAHRRKAAPAPTLGGWRSRRRASAAANSAIV